MNEQTLHITVVGLGPGSFTYLSLQTFKVLQKAACVLLRTERHPAVTDFPTHGISYRTCDDLYEQHTTFEAVYHAVVERVLALAAKEHDVVYAVPGDPYVAESTIQLLLKEVAQRPDIILEIFPAIGALNVIMARLMLDPGNGLVIADAHDPRLRFAADPPLPIEYDAYHGVTPLINPTTPMLWFQVDTKMVVSHLKLHLLDHYPPEHLVTVLTAVGVDDEEEISVIPLAELDHGTKITHLTSVYVPQLPWQQRKHTIYDLRILMALLRSEHGCPWDREQDMRGLRRTIIEEAYEVVDAIDRDNPEAITDELGDLLLNIIFVAQFGSEEGIFSFDDVVQTLAEKLIRRHAHVFGDIDAATAVAVLKSWEHIKAGERKEKGDQSIFADVPTALPALARSQKLQKRAARVGFDWLDFRGPLLKLHEELEELSNELGIMDTWSRPDILANPLVPQEGMEERVASATTTNLIHEVGDIFFAAVNLCRFLHVDAEEVMREANDRFMRRFQRLEGVVHARGQRVEELPLEKLDDIWLEIKGVD